MRIGDVLNFLEGVKAQEGDIKIQAVTGFWVRQDPDTDERMVVFAVGKGQALGEPVYSE